jgi:hypothetical protein
VIDSDHPHLLEQVRGLTGSEGELAQQLFRFVRDEIRYDFTPVLDGRDCWRASATLERRKGFCQQKAVLLAALCRAVGIPSAICFQHIRDHKLLDARFTAQLPGGIIAFHGLAALWLEGRWVRVDPSLDAKLCQIRRYRCVEFDGVHEALLPATDLDGRPHFDFLEQLGPFADLPRAVSSLGVKLRPTWDALRALAKKTDATL